VIFWDVVVLFCLTGGYSRGAGHRFLSLYAGTLLGASSRQWGEEMTDNEGITGCLFDIAVSNLFGLPGI